MSNQEQFVDRRELEQLSGAETATHKVTVKLPDFIQDEAIDKQIVTVSYKEFVPYSVHEKGEARGYMANRTRQLSPSETAAFFDDEVLPDGCIVDNIVTEQVPVYVDMEKGEVHFTAEGLTLGAMRAAILKGMRLGSTGYRDSNSGHHKTGAAVYSIKQSLSEELRLSDTPTYQIPDSYSGYYSPRGNWKPVEGRGTKIYLNRPQLTQEEIDSEIEKHNVPGLQEAKEMGLPTNIEIYHRVGARTGCSNGWVVRPDGSLRDPDETPLPGRSNRAGEGSYKWRQVLPGELVLRWGKQNTAAEHEFEVVYAPEEDLTEAQLGRIAEIQQGLEDTWAGLRGISSGTLSPAVGRGWGLGDIETPPAPPKLYETSESDSFDEEAVQSPEPIDMETALQRLMDKYNQNR